MNDLELLTVKELQAKLVELGMPEDDVQAFRTKAPLIASIKTLGAKEAIIKGEEEEVKKVVDFLANNGKGLNLTYAVRDGIICHNGEEFEQHIVPKNKRNKPIRYQR